VPVASDRTLQQGNENEASRPVRGASFFGHDERGGPAANAESHCRTVTPGVWRVSAKMVSAWRGGDVSGRQLLRVDRRIIPSGGYRLTE